MRVGRNDGRPALVGAKLVDGTGVGAGYGNDEGVAVGTRVGEAAIDADVPGFVGAEEGTRDVDDGVWGAGVGAGKGTGEGCEDGRQVEAFLLVAARVMPAALRMALLKVRGTVPALGPGVGIDEGEKQQ